MPDSFDELDKAMQVVNKKDERRRFLDREPLGLGFHPASCRPLAAMSSAIRPMT